MPFEAGKPRHPTAGRKKGTPNKNTLPIEQRCAEAGCDPLEILFECLKDPQYKFQAAKELMQYVYPKRGILAIDHSYMNDPDPRIVEEISEAVKREGLLDGAE